MKHSTSLIFSQRASFFLESFSISSGIFMILRWTAFILSQSFLVYSRDYKTVSLTSLPSHAICVPSRHPGLTGSLLHSPVKPPEWILYLLLRAFSHPQKIPEEDCLLFLYKYLKVLLRPSRLRVIQSLFLISI